LDEHADDVAHDGALSELIEAELRIRDEIAAAEEGALRALETAREEAATRLEQLHGEFAKAEHALRARVAREGKAALKEIETSAARQADRYAETDDATVRSLARWLARRVARGDASS
jgi:vacuolar-type H+-ATPase subunit H